MKNNLILLFISIFIYQNNYCQTNTTWKKGKIKKIIEYEYSVNSSFGQIKKIKPKYNTPTTYSYNKNGRLIYSEYSDGVSKTHYSKTNITYNENEIIEDYYYRDYSRKYFYNKQGDIISIINDDNDTISTFKYKYNKNNLKLRELQYGSYGKLSDSIIFSYNNKGLLVKKMSFGNYDKYVWSYIYDSNSNAIKILRKKIKDYDWDEDEIYTYVNKFKKDKIVNQKIYKNGNLTSNDFYSSIFESKAVSKIIYSDSITNTLRKYHNYFDKNKNLIKYEIYSENDLLVGYGFNVFNSENQLVKNEQFDFERTVKKYKNDKLVEELNYDANGNTTSSSFYYYNYDKLLKEKIKYKNDEIVEKTIYEYNNSGYVKTTLFPKSNKKTIVIRDNKKGTTLEKEYKKDKIISEWSIIVKGNLKKKEGFRVFSENKKATLKSIWVSNDFNEIKKRISKWSDEELETFTYKYEYDLNNNWIKKIDYKNGVPVKLKERTIIYW